MKSLITGGAGFIGSHLADALLDRGHEVIVVDDLSTGDMRNVSYRAYFAKHGITGICAMAVLEWHRPDVIFHLAARPRIQPSFGDPHGTLHNNIVGTLNVLEYARKSGIGVVYAGSSTAFADTMLNPYAWSKHTGEELCRLYSRLYRVPTAIARFFNVYGPRQLSVGAYATVIGIFERQHRAGEALTVTGDGEQRRDFTHVSDIVAGLIAMHERGPFYGELFQLGTGVNHSINEVAAMFGGAVQYSPARPGEARETLADIGKSRDVLGYEPKVRLGDYVQSVTQNPRPIICAGCDVEVDGIEQFKAHVQEVHRRFSDGVVIERGD